MLRNLFTFSALTLAGVAGPASAAILITEVDSNGSSNATYANDWFELTNTGDTAVDITGWKVDDSSPSFATAVPIRTLTSIPANTRVVFIESGTSGANDASVQANFKTAWFGASVPAGFLIASYGGPGVGLSSSGDAVNLYNAAGDLITNVNFAAATAGRTFDNTAGATGTISALSTVGTNDAFTSADTTEVGSPGTLVPEPASLALIGLAGFAGLRRRRA